MTKKIVFIIIAAIILGAVAYVSLRSDRKVFPIDKDDVTLSDIILASQMNNSLMAMKTALAEQENFSFAKSPNLKSKIRNLAQNLSDMDIDARNDRIVEAIRNAEWITASDDPRTSQSPSPRGVGSDASIAMAWFNLDSHFIELAYILDDFQKFDPIYSLNFFRGVNGALETASEYSQRSGEVWERIQYAPDALNKISIDMGRLTPEILDEDVPKLFERHGPEAYWTLAGLDSVINNINQDLEVLKNNPDDRAFYTEETDVVYDIIINSTIDKILREDRDKDRFNTNFVLSGTTAWESHDNQEIVEMYNFLEENGFNGLSFLSDLGEAFNSLSIPASNYYGDNWPNALGLDMQWGSAEDFMDDVGMGDLFAFLSDLAETEAAESECDCDEIQEQINDLDGQIGDALDAFADKTAEYDELVDNLISSSGCFQVRLGNVNNFHVGEGQAAGIMFNDFAYFCPDAASTNALAQAVEEFKKNNAGAVIRQELDNLRQRIANLRGQLALLIRALEECLENCEEDEVVPPPDDTDQILNHPAVVDPNGIAEIPALQYYNAVTRAEKWFPYPDRQFIKEGSHGFLTDPNEGNCANDHYHGRGLTIDLEWLDEPMPQYGCGWSAALIQNITVSNQKLAEWEEEFSKE